MITWDKNMRCGEKVVHSRKKLIRRITRRKPVINIYCIAIASNARNLLDIYNANELMLPYYKKTRLHMVGLARGRDEALQLAADMITEIYLETDSFNVRDYFS